MGQELASSSDPDVLHWVDPSWFPEAAAPCPVAPFAISREPLQEKDKVRETKPKGKDAKKEEEEEEDDDGAL